MRNANTAIIVLFISSLFWFLVALIDSVAREAGDFYDLGIVGQFSVVMFFLCFAALIVLAILWPVAKLIITKVKQLWL